MFQDFFNWQINILCIFWFNILRLFIPYTYTQNSLHFNSSFSSLTLLPFTYTYTLSFMLSHVKFTQTKNDVIYLQFFDDINLVLTLVSHLILTDMNWLQPRKRGLHFILNNNGNYDFDIKVGRYGFVGFVNDVIDCGCLRCVFCFKIKEKEKHTFYINFYYVIFLQSWFFFCFFF